MAKSGKVYKQGVFMLSLDYIRNNTAKVQEMLDKRNDNIDLKKLLELDAQYRAELLKLETLLASKNAISTFSLNSDFQIILLLYTTQ